MICVCVLRVCVVVFFFFAMWLSIAHLFFSPSVSCILALFLRVWMGMLRRGKRELMLFLVRWGRGFTRETMDVFRVPGKVEAG